MDEPFTLIVDYRGKTHHLEACLQLFGYSHKFKVVVEETGVFFEPDEEGNYRAVLPAATDEKTRRRMDPGLLQAIADKIKEILA